MRTVRLGGEWWFVAKDVCDVIDLKPKYAMSRISDEEKCKVARTDLGLPPGQPMNAVSESGLYELIMRSDKPEAKKFQGWVTRDALPAIRKDGAYIMGEEKVASGVLV